MKYRNTLNINALFNRRVPWINTHFTRLHGRGRLDRRRQHGVVSGNDTLPSWRAGPDCWTELDIDTLPNWRTPCIRAQCARILERERLCGRRNRSAPLDIRTLPSWRAPWICAQCARIHGRKTLRQALPKAKLSAGTPQDKDFSQSSAYYATQHAFPPDVVKIVFFQEIGLCFFWG